MNLPNSIEVITTTVSNDAFIERKEQSSIQIDDLVLLIKQKLPLVSLKAFEEGLVYYKSAKDERTIVGGLLTLLSENLTKSIAQSTDIDDNLKNNIITYNKDVVNSIVKLYDSHLKHLTELNKNKNILDINSISYIILGYAIDTIKKINNSQQQNS